MCVIYYSTQILLILLFKYCRGSKHRRFCTLVLENNVNYVAWGGEEVPEKNELFEYHAGGYTYGYHLLDVHILVNICSCDIEGGLSMMLKIPVCSHNISSV